MKQIDIKTANECILAYAQKMKKLGITSPKTGLTTSLSFKSKELMEWMQSVSSRMAELRVIFGTYTAHLSPENQGRDTVFLWPYNEDGEPATDEDGNPVLPVNLGDILP